MECNYNEFFTNWKDWNAFENRVDNINGVYAFRLRTSFNRLKGESHVLYIGKCEQNAKRNKRPGLWHRLSNYRQENKGASDRLKIVENEFGGKANIEYAYVECQNARVVEKALIDDYYEKHLELPPLNRSK